MYFCMELSVIAVYTYVFSEAKVTFLARRDDVRHLRHIVAIAASETVQTKEISIINIFHKTDYTMHVSCQYLHV